MQNSEVTVSATVRSSCLEAFQERQRFLELGKLLLFGFEFAGVDAAADAFHFHRVLDIKPPYSASERVTLLLLGALAIWFAKRGVSTGEVDLKFATFKRSENELLFWFGIGMNILMGITLLLGAVFGTDIWK